MTRNVGRGRENEKIQEYQPFQQGRKQIESVNTEVYNRFFQYCENIGTVPLQEYQQNSHESWRNSLDGESQVSQIRHEKCPISDVKKFTKHESVNLIRLKQTAKLDTMETERNEKTTEAIQKAEKNFALDLLLLVEETTRDVKIPTITSAIETKQGGNMFYPYQQHRRHLTTRFGLLF